MSYFKNIQQAQSSDIFHLNNLNKPEIIPTRTKHTVNRSVDFMSDLSSSTLPNKSVRINKSFQSSVFVNSPPDVQPGRKYLAKTTLVLGKDDTPSHHIKKDKSQSSYDPNLYFKNLTAHERKLKQYYNMEQSKDQTGNVIKSSIGLIKAELNAFDNAKISSSNHKEKKFLELYHPHPQGELPDHSYQKVPKKKLAKNSTETDFRHGKECIYNHVESLKSNIFFNSEQEKRNNEMFALKYVEPKDNEGLCFSDKKDYMKKNQRLIEDEIQYKKVDWRDPKCTLHFRHPSNPDFGQLTAHDRKQLNLYGKTDPQFKRTIETDSNVREALESSYHSINPKKNYSQIKKHMEKISTIDGNVPSYSIKVNKADRTCKEYEVTNFSQVKDVNVAHLQKVFINKGMHIYGTKADTSYYDGKTKGKLTFSIRENNDDNGFEQKFNAAREELKKETGLDIKSSNSNYKKTKQVVSSVPSDVHWYSKNVEKYVKCKDMQPSSNDKTHSKGPYKSEKITNSVVSLTYKKK